MQTPREGMLRPEFRDWYPSLEAGQWYPADELTALVADHFRHGSPQWRPQGRVPSDVHFEFRGESSRRDPGRRTRSGDRAQRLTDGPASSPRVDP